MTHIKARKGESFEKMLRKFNKSFEQSGTLAIYKDKRRYEKPTDKKRREKKLALRNMKFYNKIMG